jgi:hypothetical protein
MRAGIRNTFTVHSSSKRRPGSVVSIAMGCTVQGSNLGGVRIFTPVQTGPGTHQASCTLGTASFPRVKSGRDVTLTPHPLLVPWSWKSRAIPLLPLWAVRPVQSLSACTRVTFTFLPVVNNMAQDRDRWRALVGTVRGFRVPWMRRIFWLAAKFTG